MWPLKNTFVKMIWRRYLRSRLQVTRAQLLSFIPFTCIVHTHGKKNPVRVYNTIITVAGLRLNFLCVPGYFSFFFVHVWWRWIIFEMKNRISKLKLSLFSSLIKSSLWRRWGYLILLWGWGDGSPLRSDIGLVSDRPGYQYQSANC